MFLKGALNNRKLLILGRDRSLKKARSDGFSFNFPSKPICERTVPGPIQNRTTFRANHRRRKITVRKMGRARLKIVSHLNTETKRW